MHRQNRGHSCLNTSVFPYQMLHGLQLYECDVYTMIRSLAYPQLGSRNTPTGYMNVIYLTYKSRIKSTAFSQIPR
jgi:hypothetical protein